MTVKHRTGRKLGVDMQAKAVESTDRERQKSAEEQALENLPAGATECWRPTADDVDRISWGKPAKKKMTGSRGVPHRLNDEERRLYDFARRKGFVEIGGSGLFIHSASTHHYTNRSVGQAPRLHRRIWQRRRCLHSDNVDANLKNCSGIIKDEGGWCS